ncbi:hypothetical protein ACFOU2_01195 [Bacillus songklensis]|uniref:Uncharacterized protein n=1 Tax=Bacillus songklensis TaxID=1069116 RepID=A0ABV8AW82_9BACI
MKIQRFSIYGKSIIFTLAVVLFLVFQLAPFKGLGFMLSIVSIMAIAFSLRSCHFFTRLMSVVFLALGTLMAGSKGIDFLSYVKLYGDMLYLLSLFAIVPLLSIPIQVGGYRKVFEQLFQRRVKSISQLYRVVTGLSYFLGSFLNMAAIPIVHSSIKSAVEAWPIGKPKRFLASGIIHGYSLPIMWTPLSGIVGVVLYATEVRWLHIFPMLFFISLVTLVFNWIIFSMMEDYGQSGVGQRETAAAEEHVSLDDHPFRCRKMLQILFAIVLLLFLIVSIDAIFSLGLVVSVTLLTVPFAWIWCLSLRKNQAFWLEVKHHFTRKVGEMSESFAIFLSAGFFVQALHYSGNDYLVNELFVQFKELVGVHLFLILIPYITLLLAYIGMHPIVVVNLLAQSLKPAILGITPEQMAIAFLGGAVMTFYMGPFSGTLGLMSSIIDVAPFRIARWSLVYAIGFSLILATAILLV